MDDEAKGQPHDALFRRAFAQLDDARTALAAALPVELATVLDLDGLAPLPARIVDEVLRPGESDALFEVPVRGTNVRVVLYVPVEHQSTPDADIPLRLLRTQLRLWEKQREQGLPLSPVVPLVVSHGRPWTSPRDMLDRLGLPEDIAARVARYTPRSTYLLDDLARFDPNALARRPILSPLVRVTYFLLQRGRESPSLDEELPLVSDDLRALGERPGALAILVACMRYTLLVANADSQAMRDRLRDAIGARMEEAVMGTLAEQLIERGRVEGEARGRVEGEARGRVEGEARGRVEGEARGRIEMLTRQLTLKFGAIPEDVHDRLSRTSVERLDAYAARVLDAPTLEDVLRDG